MLFSELKCKDVINVRDCKKLGHGAGMQPVAFISAL